jgi:hypothetical protein
MSVSRPIVLKKVAHDRSSRKIVGKPTVFQAGFGCGNGISAASFRMLGSRHFLVCQFPGQFGAANRAGMLACEGQFISVQQGDPRLIGL